MSLLIKNATIVNANGTEKKSQDILCEKGKITKIAASIKDSATKTIDAKGKLVMPGLIDMHVHFRTPGQEYKETMETGCKSAAKGGFTTVLCMPNTNPVIDNVSIVESLFNEAREVGLCNVYPIAAITKGQKDEELVDICELKKAGCLALSDDGKSVVNSQLMRHAIDYAKMADILLIQHCEDPLLSAGGVMNEGAVSTAIGLKGDPGLSESVIVSRDIELARYLGGRVHFAHMSLRRCIELIRFAKSQGINVTAEACPHHFTLTEEACREFDTCTKVNPPLRTDDDVAAVKEGIADGTIDCIVTDHAPHSYEDKEVNFDQAPFGMIGLETSVGLTITELVKKKVITYEQMVDKMSTAQAKILGLEDKGVIAEGKDADITIIDPDEIWEVKKEDIVSKSKNSPFYGRKLTGKVTNTICGGKVSYSA